MKAEYVLFVELNHSNIGVIPYYIVELILK